ncbi:hypothetical protein BGZ65_012982, partial [Modicella reniformis]
AWIKYLIKVHYEQSGSFKKRLPAATTSSSSLSSSGRNSPALGTPTSRLSVAAMASQLVTENTAGSQTQPMFENEDMIDIVEDCLQNILVHVSPLIRSVLNTVIEYDVEVKEKIGPILKQIDQRIATGSSGIPIAILPTIPVAVSSFMTPMVSSVSTLSEATSVGGGGGGGGVWQEGPSIDAQNEDTEMGGDTATDETKAVAEQNSESSSQQDADNNSILESPPEDWTLYDADFWRSCPIGCLPGGIVPDLSLPWDLDRPPIARVMI